MHLHELQLIQVDVQLTAEVCTTEINIQPTAEVCTTQVYIQPTTWVGPFPPNARAKRANVTLGLR